MARKAVMRVAAHAVRKRLIVAAVQRGGRRAAVVLVDTLGVLRRALHARAHLAAQLYDARDDVDSSSFTAAGVRLAQHVVADVVRHAPVPHGIHMLWDGLRSTAKTRHRASAASAAAQQKQEAQLKTLLAGAQTRRTRQAVERAKAGLLDVDGAVRARLFRLLAAAVEAHAPTEGDVGPPPAPVVAGGGGGDGVVHAGRFTLEWVQGEADAAAAHAIVALASAGTFFALLADDDDWVLAALAASYPGPDGAWPLSFYRVRLAGNVDVDTEPAPAAAYAPTSAQRDAMHSHCPRAEQDEAQRQRRRQSDDQVSCQVRVRVRARWMRAD